MNTPIRIFISIIIVFGLGVGVGYILRAKTSPSSVKNISPQRSELSDLPVVYADQFFSSRSLTTKQVDVLPGLIARVPFDGTVCRYDGLTGLSPEHADCSSEGGRVVELSDVTLPDGGDNARVFQSIVQDDVTGFRDCRGELPATARTIRGTIGNTSIEGIADGGRVFITVQMSKKIYHIDTYAYSVESSRGLLGTLLSTMQQI